MKRSENVTGIIRALADFWQGNIQKLYVGIALRSSKNQPLFWLTFNDLICSLITT